MSNTQLTRGEAFADFDVAAQALDTARADSKTMCEQAQALDKQAAGLREQARNGVDRALIAYVSTHKRLRAVIDLDTWDSRRADELVKSAAVMAPFAIAGNK